MGIGSVIVLSSIGAGFEKKLLADIKDSVRNGVNVSISRKYTLKKGDVKQKHYFTDEDIKIMNNFPFIKAVQPDINFNGTVNNDKFVNVMGNYSNETFYLKSPKLVAGRLFFPEEYKKDSNVVLIDQLSSKTLFKNESPIGKTININRLSDNKLVGKYTIIGVFKSYGESALSLLNGGNYVELIAPTQHLNYLTGNDFTYSSLQLDFKNTETFKQDVETLKQYISRKAPEKSDFYSIKPLSEEVNQISKILNTVSGFISIVAAISLVVGGIGVMNIMLVSVNERITEIGLRKAIGAKNRDIKLQFLIESMILTIIGGIIGVSVGLGIASFIGIFIKVVPYLKLSSLVISMVVSLSIGLIFGIYPAAQAAKLSPMEALRKE